MKHAKKLVSILLTLVMILAMSVTAFAEEDNHTYELYQIFTGDYSQAKKVLSNVKWGANGIGTKEEAVPSTILEELTAVNSQTDSQKLDIIKKYVNLDSAAMSVTPTSDNEGNVTYTGLPTGYYLIKDEDDSVKGNDVYSTYVVQVTDGTLTFSRKGNVPTVDKKIVEGEDTKDVNEASIGDTINFKVTGTLPSNIDDYKEYTYLFTDTLSKGLTYNENSIKVCIVNGTDEIDVTQYFYKNTGSYDEDNGTPLTVGISNLKALGNLTPSVTIDNNSKIIVTYNATLNENAVIAGTGNDNKVKLNYSNDPNNSGDGTTAPPPENPDEPDKPKGETPESRTVTYTTELAILKNDGNKKVLTGAEFTLTGNGVNIVLVTTEKFEEAADGEYWKLKDGTYTTEAPIISGDEENSDSYESTTTKYKKTADIVTKGAGKPETTVAGTVGEDGYVTFTGLGAGTYTITESKTPAGYNTISPITFTLSFDKETKTFESDNANIVVGADNMLDTTIVNLAGSTLPSTGGIGTTIFYVLGGILVVGAGVLLVVRRRMNMEK